MKTEFRIGGETVTVRENLMDRLVRYLDPVKAQRRFQARAMSALAGGYIGASRSRRALSQWNAGAYDADTDTLTDLPTLRARSRDLIRNAPLASGAINTVCTNAVGTGLKLQSRVDREALGMTEKEADRWEAATEREWALFAESQECDAGRTLNFADMQDLVFRSALESGDVFVLMPHFTRPGSPYGLKLQVIEADRVCNKGDKPDGDGLSGGVEKDRYGAPMAYHILNHHPGNWLAGKKREWQVVPVFGRKTDRRNAIHLYQTLRPGQTRGVPYLAPVIEPLKQLDRYTEAELMAAVVSGMFTVFIETATGDGELSPMTPTAETGGSSTDTDYKLAPGAMIGLAPGESVKSVDPGRPNAAFDPFVMAILRQIGVALEIPFELLVKH
ncbi:MAG: phage portal protein, partial [Deltaproteobacteria bacterium]|nr:phage portal protein [Deltaproteobacteria bacterium]